MSLVSPFGVRAGPFYASTGRTGCGSVLAGIFVLLLVAGLIIAYWQVALLIVGGAVVLALTVRGMRRR